MAPTLLYLLKANAVLLLFAAAYYGLLRRLTFFTLNRAYLLGALVFAAVYPVLPVPALLPASVALPPALVAHAAGQVAAGAAAPTPGFDWQAAALWLYAAGAGTLLLRLLAQLLSLARVRARSRPTWVLGQPVRVLPGAGGPFSFGSTIYLSESTLADTAALPPALRHEQAHVRQWHTLDVLLAQLLSLARVRARSRPTWVLGQPVRVLPGAGGPFSFGRTIYLSESSLADLAALPPALRHEQAHVRQWHTLDVLLTQLATALAWANPAAWLLRRAVLDNLEYLADEAALRTGLDRRAYQYSLLRQQPGGVPAPALAFHFSFLTLKNRITMLNQPASTTAQLGRYLLAAPLVVLLALGYTGARAQTAPATAQPTVYHPNIPANALYYLDGKPSTKEAVGELPASTIFDMDIIQDEPAKIKRVFGNTTATSAVIITTKANDNAPAVLALREKADLGSAYVYTPVEANALVPKALAYITSHYPDARLSGKVMEMKKKTTGAVKYQVELIKGRQPSHVYFSPQGDFLGE